MDLSQEKEIITADPFGADIFASQTSNENESPDTPDVTEKPLSWFKLLPNVSRSDADWNRLLNNLPIEFSDHLPSELARAFSSLLILPEDDAIEFSLLVRREIGDTENLDARDLWYFSYGIEASEAEITLEIDNAVAVWLVDAALGDNHFDKADFRELTPSETAVLEFLGLNLAHSANSNLNAPLFKLRSLTRAFPVSAKGENDALLALDWQIVCPFISGVAKMYISTGALRALQPDENRLIKTNSRRATSRNLSKLIRNARMRLAIGAVELSIGELAALDYGDVVLFDNRQLALADGNLFGRAEVLFGSGGNLKIIGELLTDSFAASALIDEPNADGDNKIFVRRLNAKGTLQIVVENFEETENRAAREQFMNETEENFSVDENEPDASGQTGFAVENLAVTLSVELEARRLTLAEIGSLRENQVLELGIRPTDAVNILVDNQTIGRGELVAVEDRLGVRITKLLR